MSRLNQRVSKLEGRSTNNFPRRGFVIHYSKDKTDQSYDDFVASEKARLGVTDDDHLMIFRPVAPADVRKVT